MSAENSEYRVQAERLERSAGLPAPTRLLSRLFARTLVGLVAGWPRRRQPPARSATAPLRIMLTGRLESQNWADAHLLPLLACARVGHITLIVSDALEFPEGVRISAPPARLRRIAGDTAARLVWLLVCARRERPDIVGGFHLLVNGLFANLVARIVAARSLYFCVGGWSEIVGGGVYSGTALFRNLGRADSGLERQLLAIVRSTDLVVTMGAKAQRFFRERGVARVEVIPGGIQPGFSGAGGGEKRYDLVLVARLDPIKRIDRLVEIVARLKSERPSVSALIVGDGGERGAIEAAIERTGTGGNIELAGFRRDVDRLLACARLFVLTSDSEGLPLSVMEAMTAGLPVVASDVGDLAQIVSDGRNGYLVAPGDIDAFVARLGALLDNEVLYRRLAAGATATAASFGFDAAVVRWTEALERL